MLSDNRRMLSSWKEIAAYLRVSVRTAQLWESERGLPVTRPPGKRGVVWASADELDAWRKSAAEALRPSGLPESPIRTRNVLWGLAAAVFLTLAGWGIVSVQAPQDEAARSAPLASSPGAEWEASFSPDGTQVAYIWNGDCGCEPLNLYVKPLAGGPARRLTNGPWREQFPRWSPDGKWIAVGRANGAAVDIVLLSPDGEQQRNLTRLRNLGDRHETGVSWVSWLPDSKSVAIIERPDLDGPYTVFQLALDTGERQQLTFPPIGFDGDRQCAFSPDGRYLAFVRYEDGTSSDLYLASLDGGEPRRLTNDRIYHSGLAWTPDSREIIYGAQRKSIGWGLWRIEPHAFGAVEPVRVPGVQEDASWPSVASIPGTGAIRVVYNYTRVTVNLHRWDSPGAAGAGPKIVCPSTRFDVAAQYSRDGSRIAFISSRENWREIWVCNADGSDPRKITSLEGQHTDSPRWDPDGQQLAFTTSFEGNRDVWIADLRTGNLERLTREPSHEGRATWSSDGRWIYFRSNRSGQEEIWKTLADGTGEAIQLTSNGAFEPFEALDGNRLYYAKDREYRGVWSVPTTGGDETFVTGDVREGLWSVAVDGIHFVVDGEIRSYRFSTGKVEPIARIPGAPALWSGFSVRPDGQSYIWSQTTRYDQDIMMLETASR